MDCGDLPAHQQEDMHPVGGLLWEDSSFHNSVLVLGGTCHMSHMLGVAPFLNSLANSNIGI
jgi:hypothetical protein